MTRETLRDNFIFTLLYVIGVFLIVCVTYTKDKAKEKISKAAGR